MCSYNFLEFSSSTVFCLTISSKLTFFKESRCLALAKWRKAWTKIIIIIISVKHLVERVKKHKEKTKD